MELQVRGGNKLTVADAAFGREFNEALVHQVVTAYFAGGRQGTKAQKTRSEVSGGGIKPFKQKGSGRARAGTIRSPLWRHGGIIFAAKPRDFGQKVNKKMYQGAIRAIVSELARQERLIVVNEIAVEDHKTKSLLAKLADLGVQDALLVTDEVPANLELAARNLTKVAVCGVAGLNPVTLLRHENVVMTVDAVRKVEEWLA